MALVWYMSREPETFVSILKISGLVQTISILQSDEVMGGNIWLLFLIKAIVFMYDM